MKTETVTLLDDTKQVVNEITYGDWLTTRNEGNDFDNDVALIRACTGLAVDAIDSLKVPDYNELRRSAIKLNNPSQELKAGASVITLSKPVFTIMGDTTALINITMPLVKVSRELSRITDHTARMSYMIKSTTGIADLNSLPMSDYSLLADCVPDFFAQGAAFFRASK